MCFIHIELIICSTSKVDRVKVHIRVVQWSIQPYICTLNTRHFVYVTSRTTCICTLTLSTLQVEHIISSIWIKHMKTRSHWKFRICTTNDLTLYSFSSLCIFVTWGWPTVAETCRQPNKTKTVLFLRTFPLLICIKHDGDDASKDETLIWFCVEF